MQVRDYLDALRQLPFVDLPAIAGAGPIAILSPHPDDDALGCGGLIASARRAGRWVSVVTLTDGSGSHPGSKSHPPDVLAAVRHRESRAAGEALGLDGRDLVFLDMKDTAAPLAGPVFDAAVDRIDGLVRSTGASALFVTSGLDPHCDHEAAAALARAVAGRNPNLRLWFYPIWSWHLPPESNLDLAGPPSGVRFDITPVLEAKRTAIACHASQMSDLIADDPDGFRFTPTTLDPFLQPFEVFIEVVP